MHVYIYRSKKSVMKKDNIQNLANYNNALVEKKIHKAKNVKRQAEKSAAKKKKVSEERRNESLDEASVDGEDVNNNNELSNAESSGNASTHVLGRIRPPPYVNGIQMILDAAKIADAEDNAETNAPRNESTHALATSTRPPDGDASTIQNVDQGAEIQDVSGVGP